MKFLIINENTYDIDLRIFDRELPIEFGPYAQRDRRGQVTVWYGGNPNYQYDRNFTHRVL